MYYLIFQTLITAVLVVAISELGKRSLLLGGLLASIPLTSLLALAWLQVKTGDREQVAELSVAIMWLIVPSFIFLGSLPLLMRTELPAWAAFLIAILATGAGYWIYVQVLGAFGIRL